MKNKELNLVEILNGCPKGTELYTPIFGKVRLLKVDVKDDCMPIRVELQNKGTRAFTSDGRYSVEPGSECVLFPSEDNRDWESFHICPNFKKGDFIVDYFGDNRTVMVLEDDVFLNESGNVNVACSCDIDDVYRNLCLNKIWCTVSELSKRVRYATEDEICLLLYIIDKHGYTWDKEKLELCEKEHKFKPFDKVLVREEYGTQWFANLFSHIDESHHGYKYGCCTGDYWKYCIPYEGNEDLLGTANSPKK